jgi:hypothetical protein
MGKAERRTSNIERRTSNGFDSFIRRSALGVRCSAFAFLLLVIGCHAAHVSDPLTQKYPSADPDQQMEFWHQLNDRPVACNDEAFHGLLLYLDGDDPNADYAARVNAMKSRGMLPAGFDRPADEAVTRGNLAVAIARALQIKGGIVMHVARTSPRYATRELIYLDLYPTTSSPNQTFSGSEFVGVMGRVEDWQRGNAAADAPATVLPGEIK